MKNVIGNYINNHYILHTNEIVTEGVVDYLQSKFGKYNGPPPDTSVIDPMVKKHIISMAIRDVDYCGKFLDNNDIRGFASAISNVAISARRDLYKKAVSEVRTESVGSILMKGLKSGVRFVEGNVFPTLCKFYTDVFLEKILKKVMDSLRTFKTDLASNTLNSIVNIIMAHKDIIFRSLKKALIAAGLMYATQRLLLAISKRLPTEGMLLPISTAILVFIKIMAEEQVK